MATDRLVIAGEFDPSGIVKGLDIGIASVEQFEAALRKSIQKLPQLGANEQQFANTARAVAQEVKRAADEAAVLEQRIRSMGDATGKARVSLENGARASNLLRGGLTQLAVHATGASGAIGQTAQSLAFFVGGTFGAIAAAGVVGLLAIAYNKLTEATRKARKELDDYIESQRKQNAAARSPLTRIIDDTKEARTRVAQLTAEFGKIQQVNAGLGISRLTPRQKEIIEDLKVLGETIRRINREQVQIFSDAEAEAAEDAARAHKKAADEARRHLEALQKIHNVARQMGDENRTQGAGGTATGPLAGGFIAGASEADIAAHRERLVQATKDAAQATVDLAIATAQWAREEQDALRASEEAFRVDQINKAIDAVDGLFFVLGSVTDALGGLEANAQQAFAAVENLGRAIAAGDVFGAVGAGISFIGSLFGESATAREHAAIIEANNRALDEVRASINDWNDSIEAARGAQASLGAIDPHTLDVIEAVSSLPGFATAGTEELDAQLRKVGSSLAELDAIARANGIQLLDEKGHLVAGALDQLRQALALTEQAFQKNAAQQAADEQKRAAEEFADNWKRTQEIIADSQRREAEAFARSLEEAARAAEALAAANRAAQIAMSQEVRTRFELKNRLTGVDDPVIIFDQLVEALSHSSDVLRDNIGDLNLNTPELREDFRQKMIQWLDWINSGVTTAADLGLTDAQFDELLAGAADFLDSFKESTDEATDALDDMVSGLLNVPKGLNLAEQEWLARLQNPDIPGATVGAGAGGGGFNPMLPIPAPSGGTAARPGGFMMTENAANWTLNVNGVTDPTAVADIVVTRLRRLAGSTFGDTQRWSQI